MPEASDSNYAAATRHRRPMSTAGRPPVLELIDDDWAQDKLDDDEVDVARAEAALAPMMEEGELDSDAIVSPAGNSSLAVNSSMMRRLRREENWNDLGLEQLLDPNAMMTSGTNNNNTSNGNRTANPS